VILCQDDSNENKNMRQPRMRFQAGMTLATALLLAGSASQAQVLMGQEDFTFRSVKPPADGAKIKRITVQIDPEEQARRLAPPKKTEPEQEVDVAASGVDPTPGQNADLSNGGVSPLAPGSDEVTSTYAWFWDEIPTSITARQGRFVAALAILSKGPSGESVRAPRMQHMQDIAENYGTDILKATIGTEVSPALVLAVIGIESAGNPEAVSHAGAEGLMQLIPATAERFGVTDSTDPVQNIKGGVAYLDWLMKRFDRDPLMVLAAYNAGEGAVENNAGVPPYAETRDYVPKVLAAWQVAQGLCLTPPELVSDPCVFKVMTTTTASN
jgi:hypothetical protein